MGIEKIKPEYLRASFSVELSYCELYNNQFHNLLRPSPTDKIVGMQESMGSYSDDLPDGSVYYPELAFHQHDSKIEIHDTPKTGVFLSGIPKFLVRTPQEAKSFVRRGDQLRAVGTTKNNAHSSRSHTILTLHVESNVDIQVGSTIRSEIRMGRIQFVDLAGGERLTSSYRATKDAKYTEFHNINLSLLSLGEVLATLSTKAINSQIKNSKVYRGSRGSSSNGVSILGGGQANYNASSQYGASTTNSSYPNSYSSNSATTTPAAVSPATSRSRNFTPNSMMDEVEDSRGRMLSYYEPEREEYGHQGISGSSSYGSSDVEEHDDPFSNIKEKYTLHKDPYFILKEFDKIADKYQPYKHTVHAQHRAGADAFFVEEDRISPPPASLTEQSDNKQIVRSPMRESSLYGPKSAVKSPSGTASPVKASTMHIPYKSSKLTHILKDSLGGNSKMTIITHISPDLEDYHHSLNSLTYASRAKNICNKVNVNYLQIEEVESLEFESYLINQLREGHALSMLPQSPVQGHQKSSPKPYGRDFYPSNTGSSGDTAPYHGVDGEGSQSSAGSNAETTPLGLVPDVMIRPSVLASPAMGLSRSRDDECNTTASTLVKPFKPASSAGTFCTLSPPSNALGMGMTGSSDSLDFRRTTPLSPSKGYEVDFENPSIREVQEVKLQAVKDIHELKMQVFQLQEACELKDREAKDMSCEIAGLRNQIMKFGTVKSDDMYALAARNNDLLALLAKKTRQLDIQTEEVKVEKEFNKSQMADLVRVASLNKSSSSEVARLKSQIVDCLVQAERREKSVQQLTDVLGSAQSDLKMSQAENKRLRGELEKTMKWKQ